MFIIVISVTIIIIQIIVTIAITIIQIVIISWPRRQSWRLHTLNIHLMQQRLITVIFQILLPFNKVTARRFRTHISFERRIQFMSDQIKTKSIDMNMTCESIIILYLFDANIFTTIFIIYDYVWIFYLFIVYRF